MHWTSHIRESSRRRVATSLMAGLLVLGGTGLVHGTKVSTLSISWVSADRVVLDPEKAQTVTLRYRVSAPASVTIRFVAQGNEPVRSIHQDVEKPGEQSVSTPHRF